MATLSDLMGKMADGKPLDQMEKEQLLQISKELDETRQNVKAWSSIDRRVNTDYLNLPFAPIYSEVLTENLASLTIPIPSGYKHLLVMALGRTTEAAYSTAIFMRFNGDTGTNYSYSWDGGQNTTQLAGQTSSATGISPGFFAGTSATTGSAGSFFAIIPHYTSSSWKSVMSIQGIGEWNATPDLVVITSSGFWKNTTAINSMTVYPSTANMLAGSVLSVYGIL